MLPHPFRQLGTQLVFVVQKTPWQVFVVIGAGPGLALRSSPNHLISLLPPLGPLPIEFDQSRLVARREVGRGLRGDGGIG